MKTNILIALILSTLGHKHSPKYYSVCSQYRPVMETISTITSREAIFHKVPVQVVIGVMRAESRFNPDAIGRHGEVGLMQIKPNGIQTRICHITNPCMLWDIRTNVHCGILILKMASSYCHTDIPELYISIYNGLGCGSTPYSRKVISYIQ